MPSLRYHTASFMTISLFALTTNLLATEPPKVELLKTPDGGIQPQAELDARGTRHLVYLKGDPAAADVFYVRKARGAATFFPPIRVNSQPGSAIAIGSVRGAQLAVGKNGRVHVIWNGSGKAEPKGSSNSSPMLYTRLNDEGAAFEPKPNVM